MVAEVGGGHSARRERAIAPASKTEDR